MKRRIRTQPSNPYYSDEPAVAKGLIADKPLVQDASLGNKSPKMVDKKPAKSTGFSGGAGKRPKQTKFKPSSIGAPARPKTNVKTPTQHLRMSGHPKAHRIGAIKSISKV
jgi:hypothetical protein